MILTFIFIQHHSCYYSFCVTSSQCGLHAQTVIRVWNALQSAYAFFVSQRVGSRESKFALL